MKMMSVVGLGPENGYYGDSLRFFDTAVHRLSHLGVAMCSAGHSFKMFVHDALSHAVFRRDQYDVELSLSTSISLSEIFAEDPDVLFIWNGASEVWITEEAKARGVAIIFVELGWLPQRSTLSLDHQGVGALSSLVDLTSCPPASQHYLSWRDLYLGMSPRVQPTMTGALPKRLIFVPLQMEDDSSMAVSPFESMSEFVLKVSSLFQDMLIVVRPHPNQPSVRLGTLPSNVVVNSSGNLGYWFESATAVVGLNSTVLIESLVWRQRTLSFAKGVGWNKGVYAFEGVPSQSEAKDALMTETSIGLVDGFVSTLIDQWQVSMYSLGNREQLRKNGVLSRFV